MKTTQRKLGLMAAMMAIAATNPPIMDIEVAKPEPTPDWKRKKCKSCSKWRKYDKSQGCSIRSYMTPNNQACEKYEKRK